MFITAAGQTVLQPVDALASNGDFDRVLTSLSLHAVGVNRFPFPYAQLAFTHGHTSSAGAYWTSYLPVLKAVTGVVTPLAGGTFDLRVLGLLYSVAIGVVVRAICRRFSTWATQVAVGVVLVVGLGDAHLVAYFDTFYDEAWSLLALSVCVIALLENNGRRAVPARAVWVWSALGVVLITAKTQNVPLLVAVVASTALLSVKPRHTRVGRLGPKALPVACSVAVLFASFAYLLVQPGVYSRDNLYDQVFADLLVHDGHPKADLVSLGLPASMAKYAGTSAYAQQSGIDTAQFKQFAAHHGRLRVELFYLSHPTEAFSAIGRGIKDGMHARLTYLSYRTASSGAPPGADGCGLCVFSAASSAAAATSPLPVVVLYAGALLGALLRRRRGANGLSDAILFVVVVAVVSLLTAVFGEGTYEEIKHLYLFYVCNIVILALTTGIYLDLARSRSRHARRPESEDELPDFETYESALWTTAG